MAWRESENSSPIKPASIDETSSSAVVYVRKNFQFVPEQISENDDGFSIGAHWKWLEEIVAKDQWPAYRIAMQNDANIQYMAMELGVDLDE